MVHRDSPPASVEGRNLLLSAQKIDPSNRPIFCNKIKRTVFQITATKRATAEIIQELDPKIAIIRDYSSLNLNDKISGKNLWGFSSNPINRDNVIVGEIGRTSSHSGQHVEMDGDFSFMEIVSGWRGDSLKVHPKENLLR